MLPLEDARQFALSLPEAVEHDHHGFPSFRVRSKIYLTQPDDSYVHVMADEDEIRAAVAEDGEACEEVWWGKRLSAVRVYLDRIEPAHFEELVVDAWRRKAPKTLVKQFDAAQEASG